MKTTVKKIVAVLLLTFTGAYAQEKETKNYDQGFRIGFGVNAGIPTEDPYDFNVSGDVRLQYDFSKKYSMTLTTGFGNFFQSGKNNDLGYIPAKLGFKAFVLKDQFYILGEAGAAFAVTNNYDKTSLVLSPGIGYANDIIDISLRYEHFNDFPVIKNGIIDEGLGQIALRIAYGFKL
ncbi:hypothetical protein [Flavobacterium sp.]|jgi:hypothetical protein|uniref:hypothetical protein n=1 Tax=Flavobacterium sp. TaxID=239 RepID=UPI0035AF14C0